MEMEGGVWNVGECGVVGGGQAGNGLGVDVGVGRCGGGDVGVGIGWTLEVG